MKYGNLTLYPETGSISITTKKMQIVRHYPGTDISDSFPLGKEPTVISCVLMARNNTERFTLEQIQHANTEANLYLDNCFYKKVITGDVGKISPFVDGLCTMDIEFVALDPIPYDLTSEEALY